MKSTLTPRLVVVFASLIGLCAWAGSNTITADTTKIVRGFNAGAPCDPEKIGEGSSPKAGINEEMSNLSVSCSDDKRVTWQQLRAPLPNAHACIATLGDLRKRNKNITIVKDETRDNRYHCVLSNITPKQFVSGSRHQ